MPSIPGPTSDHLHKLYIDFDIIQYSYLQANDFQFILYEIYIPPGDIYLEPEIIKLALQLTHNHILLKAGGIFPLNNTLYFTVSLKKVLF